MTDYGSHPGVANERRARQIRADYMRLSFHRAMAWARALAHGIRVRWAMAGHDHPASF